MDVEPVSVDVLYYVLNAKLQDVLDPQPQVWLKHERCCNPVILPESCTAFMHCLYDLFVLFLVSATVALLAISASVIRTIAV